MTIPTEAELGIAPTKEELESGRFLDSVARTPLGLIQYELDDAREQLRALEKKMERLTKDIQFTSANLTEQADYVASLERAATVLVKSGEEA